MGIVSDDPPATSIIITYAGGSIDVVAVGGDAGVEEGIVSLDQNDDFAMDAPPGAPGAMIVQEAVVSILILGWAR